jgi:transglutaminase-like putative cysteine protease
VAGAPDQPLTSTRRLIDSALPSMSWKLRGALAWATAAFAVGVLLNVDRVPSWVPLAAVLVVAWRVLASTRNVRLPSTFLKSVLALLLVAAVLVRFRTLNGLTAGTALLILMGAIKLLETRAQRDHYIIIGAGLFLLLAACLDRQNLLRSPLYVLHAWVCCAALAVVGYAPSAATPRSFGFDNRAALMLAARSLIFALPLALLLFVFFPRLPGALWAIPRADRATTGLSDTMSPGSIAELTSSYEVAFRAHFEGEPPPPQERYWRGPVLHVFDGSTWRVGNSYYPQQPLQYVGKPYRYRISLQPTQQRWWLSLDTVTGTPAPSVFFTYDFQLISAEPVVEPANYTLTSYTSTRSSEPLSRSGRKHDTALSPPERNPRSRELASSLRQSAASDAAFVDATLDFLRQGGFEYSLNPPRLGLDSVDDFLFHSRRGFCGHYASAFVFLMRAAGVPARVVTGYLGGEWNAIGGYLIIRQSDAHAWAEVWLEGRGWTRVDPTAVVKPELLRMGILDLLPNAVSESARFVWSTPWLEAGLQRWDAVNSWWNDRVLNFNFDDQLRLLGRLGIDSPGITELAWTFAAVLIAWLLWIAWQVGSSAPGRRPDKLAQVYARLCRKLARAGAPRDAHLGPLAYADKVRRRRPDLADKVRALLARYAQLRYGPSPGKSYPADVKALAREVARLRVATVRGRKRR